ncbi:WxcM-like domain-containing protein [Brevibacillus brevis]|uniref:WxcM-like domain-containing protein n=1 Tax=Brevibacillus brevis TaxID=1393 RepID=A0A2Z4MPW9_BREBE|nr:FdtA/QdtA family cupin domain-containing protein [Brevibacillus brevis]AWX58580.1 WxcM-like domain-containing protein [Brevibacillus brevis]
MRIELLDFQKLGDYRGSLIAIENNRNIPFDIKRIYYMFGTKIEMRRGCHAHRKLQQVLICMSGSCNISLDDGIKTQHLVLDDPSKGLYLSGLIWRELYNFSEDCIVVVLADDFYDEEEYIRDYSAFINLSNLINGSGSCDK